MKLLFVLVLTLLTGCVSQPSPEYSHYLLRSDKVQESRPLNFEHQVYLGHVTLSRYIDQPGMVLFNNDGTTHTAKYHQWAEPLRTSLRPFLSIEVASQLNYDIQTDSTQTGGTRLDIHIDQLHGNAQGEAILVATWTISSKTRRTHRFSESLPLEDDGYDALVDAEKKLLTQMAQAIARTL